MPTPILVKIGDLELNGESALRLAAVSHIELTRPISTTPKLELTIGHPVRHRNLTEVLKRGFNSSRKGRVTLPRETERLTKAKLQHCAG